MDLNITIRNIHINNISTLGSLNVGKAVFLKNRSSSIQMPSNAYEEAEFEEGELEEMKAEAEVKMEDLPEIPALFDD